MPTLKISLFKKLEFRYHDRLVVGCRSQKARELLCYLLLHHELPQNREMLASKLWGDYCTTAQSKRYLSKALWQLQAAFKKLPETTEQDFLVVDQNWIGINPSANFWLDVSVFENAYKLVQDISIADMEAADTENLKAGVKLYRGALLEGWFQDWCLCERERLQQIYLIMLDRLVLHCELTKRFDAGIYFGEMSLQCDRARERTYRQLMRLQFLLGDRTGALRQYQRCVEALNEELAVKPSAQTISLYERIKLGELSVPTTEEKQPGHSKMDVNSGVLQRLENIISLQKRLTTMQNQIHAEIKFIENFLASSR